MKRSMYVAMALVAVLTATPRLYKLTAPVADWHSFRQTDTASVARYFTEHGIDLLHPRYQDLSNIQSGKDNPEGYRMVEFPLYQAAAAVGARIVPSVSVDVWLRIISIGSAVGTAMLLMLLTASVGTPLVSFLTGLVYAVMPYSVFYGRSILPETFAVFWAMVSVYCAHAATERDTRGWAWWIVSAAGGALTLLVKPTAGFLLLPVPYSVIRRYGISMASVSRLAAYGFISLIPFWWWRQWILQFPEGIPVYDWLFNKGNIRFKGAWFQWLFAERLGKLMLGYWGLIPFGLGLLSPSSKKEGWLYHLLGFGGLLYLSVFAAGNVQHDYYQIILLPVVSVYVAKGYAFLLTDRVFPRGRRYAMVVASGAFLLAFSWYTMRTYYWINRPEIIAAGAIADRLLPKSAKVIAPYNGDTTFLYQTRRQGWPLGFDIDKKITMGATHYVTVSPTDADWETKTLAETYTVLVRNDTFAIIDLTRPRVGK